VDFQGQTIHDRYVLGAPIGEGGGATVYAAEDRRLDRRVAVKLLRPELKANRTLVARFEREARSAARLDHPHIVPVYDYGEFGDTYFLVMQYVPGGDLRDRLKQGEALPVAEAVRLGAEIAEALGVAHARGIVHRDVKPGNVLLTEDGHAKVADFGIAKMLDVSTLATGAVFLGTPHYLAPEQATGGTITPATDVYSLGVVLFEMLAGRRPFEGESFVQVVMQHLSRTPPGLGEVRAEVPRGVAAAVARALAKEPGERFADGTTFADVLRAEERALLAVAPGAASAAAVGVAESVAPGAPAEERSGPAPAAVPWAAIEEPPGETPAAGLESDPRWADGLAEGWSEPAGTAASWEVAIAGDEAPGSRAGGDTMLAPAARHPADAWGQMDRTAPRRAAREYAVPAVLAALLGLLAVGLVAGSLVWGARGDAAEGSGAGSEPGAASVDEVAAATSVAPTAPDLPAPTEAPALPTPAPAANADPGGPVAGGAPEEPAPAPAGPVVGAPAGSASAGAARGRVVLDDDVFSGGFSAPRQYRGRTAQWLYGALSPHGQMTATFPVEGSPGAGELQIAGVDSENGPQTPIEIRVNDTVIYQGGNPLPKDHWRGPVAPWGEATIPIPAGVLREGRNTLTFKNLVPVNNYNAPPYFMLDQATITYGR
jgi:serine/threonine-protein kinase